MNREYIDIIAALAPFFVLHFVFNIYFFFFRQKKYNIIASIAVALSGLALFLFYDPMVALMVFVSLTGLITEKQVLKRIPILNKVFASLLIYVIFFIRRYHPSALFAVFLVDYSIEYATIFIYSVNAKRRAVYDRSTKSLE